MTEPTPKKLQVFLCHSSGDKAQIRQLYQRLAGDAWIKLWLDEEDLMPGQVWSDEIEKAVEESQIILICLTPASISKEGFVNREIRVALDFADYKPEGTLFIIPLKIEECEVPRRLRRWQWVNYFEEVGHKKLMQSLRYQAEKLGINTAPIVPSEQPKNTPTATPDLPATQPKSEPKPTLIVEVKPPAPKPVESEQEQLLRELEDLKTSHARRRDIGIRLSEIGDIRPSVGVRADGTPDIVWQLVSPGGKIKIADETHEVQPFYIARYPVTYAQFQAFVEAKDEFNNLQWWEGMPRKYQQQELAEQSFKGPSNPRDSVSWYDAVAFSRWLNAQLQGWQFTPPDNANGPKLRIGSNAEVRLPSEWEWQWAAQGGSANREYPWGKWQDGYANTREAELNQTIAVGMYPQGAALCGAQDMNGQVWEWCLNNYSEEYPYPVLRGGSWYHLPDVAACAFRYLSFYPFNRNFVIGFRLVVGSPMRL